MAGQRIARGRGPALGAALSAALFAILAGSAHAAPLVAEPLIKVEQAPPAAPVSPEQRAAAQRLAASQTVGMDSLIKSTLTEVIAEIGDSVPPNEAQWVSKTLVELADILVRDLMEEWVTLYARDMTLEELTAAAEFYESPVGASVARKTMALNMELEPILVRKQSEMLAEFLKRYCTQFECPTQATPGAAAKSPGRP